LDYDKVRFVAVIIGKIDYGINFSNLWYFWLYFILSLSCKCILEEGNKKYFKMLKLVLILVMEIYNHCLGWEDRIARDEKNEELKSQIKFVSLKCKLSCIFPVEGFNTFLLTTNGNNIINF